MRLLIYGFSSLYFGFFTVKSVGNEALALCLGTFLLKQKYELSVSACCLEVQEGDLSFLWLFMLRDNITATCGLEEIFALKSLSSMIW